MERISERKRAMARWIVIQFVPANQGGDALHMIGNWAEDLWRVLREDRRAYVDWDPGRTIDRLAIAVVHVRDVKAISATVEQALEDHYLSDIARTSIRGPDASA
jgi:hypothetical protein